VFLEPLVDELMVTWDKSVRTYDANSRSFFNMKAILMWLIHDFLVYGNMVIFTTKGFYACSICGKKMYSEYLIFIRKCVYIGHGKYLPENHMYHSQKGSFNGKLEHRIAPKIVQVLYIFPEIEGREEN
jgi:hypothetical protein